MSPHWSIPHSLEEAMAWPPVRIAFLLLIGVVLRGVVHRVINAGVRRIVDAKTSDKRLTLIGAERRDQRMEALGSMTRALVTTVIAVVIGIMVFDELGFNVATIIAGTSVLGVAIAFGLQSIVKDLLSGVFMLIEDQLGVGDYVDMDKASGTVESVGLRVTRLRDDNGNVWYVRNGEVLRVGNFSQGGSERPVPPPVAAWTLSYSPAANTVETHPAQQPHPAQQTQRSQPDPEEAASGGAAAHQAVDEADPRR